jgi:hypothetical protein
MQLMDKQMIEATPPQENGKRFFRDGAPYIDNFETVVSLLIGKVKQQDVFIQSTLCLIRSVHDHLADCQELLGKTEKLVEDARKENQSDQNIDKLVMLCKDLQSLQTTLVDSVLDCTNEVIDEIFPR